jgi:hypothetical protein
LFGPRASRRNDSECAEREPRGNAKIFKDISYDETDYKEDQNALHAVGHRAVNQREDEQRKHVQRHHCHHGQSTWQDLKHVRHGVNRQQDPHSNTGKLPTLVSICFSKSGGRAVAIQPQAISNAIGYSKFRSRSHDAVTRVYDAASNVIETQAQGALSKNGEFIFAPRTQRLN